MSPGLLTRGSPSSACQSSGGSSESIRKSVASWSISAGSKPVTEMSRASCMSNSESSGSSTESRSRSQPELAASRLSASNRARFFASVSPTTTTAGISFSLNKRAAAHRPSPASKTKSSSTTTGDVKPTVRMLSAICRICFELWVRVLRGFGLICPTGILRCSCFISTSICRAPGAQHGAGLFNVVFWRSALTHKKRKTASHSFRSSQRWCSRFSQAALGGRLARELEDLDLKRISRSESRPRIKVGNITVFENTQQQK